jgi:hypothetical protein
MEIPPNVYSQLCYCKICLKCFFSLFEYGLHICLNHGNENISTVPEFKSFVATEILNKLEDIDYYKQLSSNDQDKLFKSVKKKLKEETAFPLTLILPDGRKSKSKRIKKSKSKSKRRKKTKNKSKRRKR